MTRYEGLGQFSDLVNITASKYSLYPRLIPGLEAQKKVQETLDFSIGREKPAKVRIDRHWSADGVVGEEVSWFTGYGPRTQAWILRPAKASGRLPGVVALHDHGGLKYYGKEKIADGPEGPAAFLGPFRRQCYGGRAFANSLAKEGFVVLIHDVFLWGSRRFSLEEMPPWMQPDKDSRLSGNLVTWKQINTYNKAASDHEHLVEKYCTVLGTTLAAIIAYEDRVAVNYLYSRGDVDSGRIGCIGLSGGGCRAAMLQATCQKMNASVIVAMMSDYKNLLNRHVAWHTWMLFPKDWARHGDWPDLAACRAPSPLMVQYALKDALFSSRGMRAADRIIRKHYQSVGAAKNYVGKFYPVPHCFDQDMQREAFDWLKNMLV